MTNENNKDCIEFDSERKYVTVIFSDISGYTKISEDLDPEEVRDILSDIYKRIKLKLERSEIIDDEYVWLFYRIQ